MASSRQEAERAHWERTLARGEKRFLITRGVLGRGLPMALVLCVGIELLQGNPLSDALTTTSFLGRLALAAAFFSVGGVLNARMRWKLMQKRYSES